MAKRFTDTEKWRDPWFCSLTCEERNFWAFLLDTCNLAGIWQVNWPLVKFYMPSFKFKDETFKDRIHKLTPEKWFIHKFIKFQYGELQETNRLHQRIIFELSKEGVSIPLEYPFQGVKDKDMVLDKVLDKEEEKIITETKDGDGPTAEDLVNLWNETAHPSLPKVQLLTEGRKRKAKARLVEHPEAVFWSDLVLKVNRSPLLTGQVGKWRCSFDWILEPSNLAKIVEGNYDAEIRR